MLELDDKESRPESELPLFTMDQKWWHWPALAGSQMRRRASARYLSIRHSISQLVRHVGNLTALLCLLA